MHVVMVRDACHRLHHIWALHTHGALQLYLRRTVASSYDRRRHARPPSLPAPARMSSGEDEGGGGEGDGGPTSAERSALAAAFLRASAANGRFDQRALAELRHAQAEPHFVRASATR